MAMGLIAAALGGAGKALSSIGEMEAKKQNEAKLRQELMDMESVEKLRLDEVMFERKMNRLPGEAIAQAKATAGAEAVGFEERNRLNVPESAAVYAARGKAAGYKAEADVEIPRLAAEQKVKTRMAELAAGKENKLDEEEARAKYNAFMTDIKIAKELGADVAEAERLAEKENARISALIKSRVPAKEAQLANERNLEKVRAQLDSTIVTEEANLLAKQELAKVQAMTAQGVPEAEAKLLSAKWKAQKAQRDEAAAEKTQQEMNDLITKMQNPNYKKARVTQEGIDVTGSLILQANRDKKEKDEKARNTKDIERQIKETEKEMGRLLGIGDPKKIPDEINYLESQAKKGKQDAIDKLAKLKPLNDELNNLSRDLRSYKRGGSDADSGAKTETYNYVPGKGLQPTK